MSHRNQLIDMQKLRHKHYSKLITTRDNVNIQFYDQEESKLNSTINVNRGTHTLRLDEIIKSPFNSFMTGGRYHIETSPFICRANQWTGFYMITASFMKELIRSKYPHFP